MAYHLAPEKSLQVLDKKTVIKAKRISEGGELLLADDLSGMKTTMGPFCAEYCLMALKQKGRGTGLGDMAELIAVGRFGNKDDKQTVPLPKFHYAGPPVYTPLKPSPNFAYETDLMNIKSLSSKSDAEPTAPPLKTSKPKQDTRERRTYQPFCSEMFADLDYSRKKLASRGKRERRRKQIVNASLARDLNTLPSHAVSIKWKLSPNLPCYTMEGVHAVLSRYGKVVSLGQLTPNSGIVVFENIDVATTVVSCGQVGFCNCPIICCWWHPHMYLQRFAKENRRIPKVSETLSKEAHLQHEFRQLQERLMACFRIRGQNLSYDHTTFIP